MKHGVWKFSKEEDGQVELVCIECGLTKSVTSGSWKNKEKPTRGSVYRVSKSCSHKDTTIKLHEVRGIKRVIEMSKNCITTECIYCGLEEKKQRGNFRNSPNNRCECLRNDKQKKRLEMEHNRLNRTKPLNSNEAFLAKFNEDAIAEKGSKASIKTDKSYQVRTGCGSRYVDKHANSQLF